jgi:hypothetical protein
VYGSVESRKSEHLSLLTNIPVLTRGIPTFDQKMVPRKPRIVTMPNTTSIQINTPSISLPTGLATLVRATEDWRQFASHSTPFPPAATTTTTTVRMMNNLAESTTHVSRPTTTTTTAPTIPFRPPRMEALCHRCGYDGVDILIRTCGCAFHAVRF